MWGCASSGELLGRWVSRYQSQISQSPLVLQPVPFWSWLRASLRSSSTPRQCHCHCPGARRGSCFLADGPCLLHAAKGRVPLNGRLFGWRLAGWYSLIGLGSARHLHTIPKDHNSGPQKQASSSLLWPATAVLTHCLFYFYIINIFDEKTHCSFPHYLCSLSVCLFTYLFSNVKVKYFFSVILNNFFPATQCQESL